MEGNERIQEDVEEEEEDDDYEEEDEEEEEDDDDEEAGPRNTRWRRVGAGHWIIVENSLNIPEFDEQDHALWVMRKTFEMVDHGESIEARGVEVKLASFDTLQSLSMRQEGILPYEHDAPPTYERERSNSF
jgi:hypothetical protein